LIIEARAERQRVAVLAHRSQQGPTTREIV
jgi:hypothetical protein